MCCQKTFDCTRVLFCQVQLQCHNCYLNCQYFPIFHQNYCFLAIFRQNRHFLAIFRQNRRFLRFSVVPTIAVKAWHPTSITGSGYNWGRLEPRNSSKHKLYSIEYKSNSSFKIIWQFCCCFTLVNWLFKTTDWCFFSSLRKIPIHLIFWEKYFRSSRICFAAVLAEIFF